MELEMVSEVETLLSAFGSALTRIIVGISMLSFVSSENVFADLSKFRKSVFCAMVFILALTVVNIVTNILDYDTISFSSYKMMRVVFVVVLLAVCYYLNGLLKRNSATITRLLYAFIGIVVLCFFVEWLFYWLYLVETTIAIYTISLLTDVRNALPYNYQQNLEGRRRMTNLCQGLIRLEVTIVIVNLCIFVAYFNGATYDVGMRNLTLAAYIQYWTKITLFLTQFRGAQMVHDARIENADDVSEPIIPMTDYPIENRSVTKFTNV